MCAPVPHSPTPPSHSPGKAGTCLSGCNPTAPQCPDTDMEMRQTVDAGVRVREVSTRTGHEAWSEDGQWDPEGRGGGTVGAWGTGSSHAPSLDFSCPGDILPLLPRWLVIPQGAMATHRGITSWSVLPMSHGRGSCTCPGDMARSHMPALPSPVPDWRSRPMDFVLPCAHSHPAPCPGGLAVPAWPQLAQAAAAPCLPPSAVQHSTVPPGLGPPGHSHANTSAHCAVPAPSHPPSPCPCPLHPVACPLQGAAGQADGYLWPLSPPAVAHGMAKGGFSYRKALPSRRMRLCQT